MTRGTGHRHPPVFVRLGRRRIHSFHLCGVIAFGAALGVDAVLAVHVRAGALPVIVATACPIATFFATALVTKVLVGHERLVYYHHEIAILATTSAFLAIAHAPVLRYLDITVLFVGTFLSIGRIGCFLAGCCYGIRCTLGIRYGADHVAQGFPSEKADVPLLPVQLIESLAVAAIVFVGSRYAWHGPPGHALVWYVTAYGCTRFLLESLRGDVDVRPHLWGVSEAQWTSAACAVVVAALGQIHLVPKLSAGLLVACFLGAMAGGSAIRHVRSTRGRRPTEASPAPLLHWTVLP
jgi:prolipoprotein diacylglyceryltransferase